MSIVRNFFENALSEVFQGHDYTKNPIKGEFRCSQIVGECSRQLVFSNILNWKRPNDDYVKIASVGGQLIHETIQSLLRSTGYFSDKNIEVVSNIDFKKAGIKFTGHTDLLIVEMNGFHYVIDIKTTANLLWRGRISKFIPKDSHIKQVSLYMADYIMSNNIDRTKVKGVLWYIERKNNEGDLLKILNPDKWFFHEFNYSSNPLSKSIAKAVNITQILERGKLPPKKDPNFWLCENSKSKCVYYDLCHGDNEVNNLNDVIVLKEEKQ